MPIDFSTELKNRDGTPLVDIDGRAIINAVLSTLAEGRDITAAEFKRRFDKVCPFTLRDACINALEASPDKPTDGKEKCRRFAFGNRIFGAASPLDIPAEDVALLKLLLNMTYDNPRVLAQCWHLLDPTTKE